MAEFRPREIARRSSLWHDKDGRPWLVILDFTVISGRLECVGMEIRSFLRHEFNVPENVREKIELGEVVITTSAGGDCPDYWDGSEMQPLTDRGYDLLPGDSLGAKVDPADVLAMSHPTPLRATVLRQLPLGDVCTRTRRQDIRQRLENAAPSGVAHDDWVKERAAVWAPKTRRGGRVAKYSHSDLERVAALYSEAYESGSSSPTKDVAERLGANRNRAAKLVWKCRKVGLLAPAQGRTAGDILPEAQTSNEPRQRPSRRRSNDEGGSDDNTT
jgi:hypothetical protein